MALPTALNRPRVCRLLAPRSRARSSLGALALCLTATASPRAGAQEVEDPLGSATAPVSASEANATTTAESPPAASTPAPAADGATDADDSVDAGADDAAAGDAGADGAPDPDADNAAAGDAGADGAPDPDADNADAEPPPLNAEEQDPPSVPADEAPLPKARAVELGFLTGVSNRPSEDDSVSYAPAITWGFYAKPYITSWLGARAYYREESVPVDMKQGALELPQSPLGNTQLEQPNLRLHTLGLRLEPTVELTRRLSVGGILGIAWLRFVAPAIEGNGELALRSGERAGVEVDLSIGALVSFELIPDWLMISGAFTHGLSTQRTGTSYDRDQPLQAFAEGHRYYLGPLPRFQSVTDLLFQIGVLL